MWSRLRSFLSTAARLVLRDPSPCCASCGRKMTATQIEPLLTTRVDVVTFTCKACGRGERRAQRRPGKAQSAERH